MKDGTASGTPRRERGQAAGLLTARAASRPEGDDPVSSGTKGY